MNKRAILNILRIAAIILIVFTMLMMQGCASLCTYVVFMGKVHVRDAEISGSYQYLNGTFIRNVELESGDVLDVGFEEHTDKGSIEIIIMDKDDNEICSLTQDEELQFIIEDEGIYKIKAIAHKHKGNFSVCWSVGKVIEPDKTSLYFNI